MKTESYQDTRWWHVTLTCEDSEESGPAVMTLGASGIEVLSPNSFRAFFGGEHEAFHNFVEQLKRLGLAPTEMAQVEVQNWVQKSDEVLAPIPCKTFTIVPVRDGNQVPDPRNNSHLYLVPGMGFGTGHHTSTRQIIEFLESPILMAHRPRTVLDVGTGSGVLGIAAHLLYDAQVLGIDVDIDALRNAEENVRINGAVKSIALSSTGLSEIKGTFDLIAANLYAEVLCTLEPLLAPRLNAGGYLVIAGVMASLEPLIMSHYRSPSWSLIKTLNQNGWVSALFRTTKG